MKSQAYVTLAANEEQGWYYEARRRAVASLIERFIRKQQPQPEPLQILDIGCGTGGTSAALRAFGAVTGIENVAVAPGATGPEASTRLRPHLKLSVGFCEAR